jgi:putative nucleotidyltransferase with HDIG domain
MDISSALASSLDRMPHFPDTFHRLMAVSRNSPDEANEIVAALSTDPVIIFRVLRVVNSAYFGMQREIGSLDHAVRVLGTNTIRNLVLTFSAVGALPPHIADSFDVNKFLLHALTTATIAQRLAEHFGDTVLPEAYTAGLLHDFGKVLLAWTFPREFAETRAQARETHSPVMQAEVRLFGTDHARLGASLAARWKFPQALTESIGNHHQSPDTQGLGRCLFLANQLPKLFSVDSGADDMLDPLPNELTSLGESYEDILKTLPNLESSVSQAQSLMAALQH